LPGPEAETLLRRTQIRIQPVGNAVTSGCVCDFVLTSHRRYVQKLRLSGSQTDPRGVMQLVDGP
ncbi:hypothetical protein NQZ68_008488, partial [Dissostichus eleginoides]